MPMPVITAAVMLLGVVAGAEVNAQDATRATRTSQQPTLQQPTTERRPSAVTIRLKSLLEGSRIPIVPRNQTWQNHLLECQLVASGAVSASPLRTLRP